MKEKAKNEKLRLDTISFFLLWVVLGAGLATISHNLFLLLSQVLAFFNETKFISETPWAMTLLDALLLAAFITPIEKILLQLRFGQWIKGWIRSRFLSIVLAVLPYILLENFGLQPLVMNNVQNILQVSIFALLTALPQVWVLRRYVQNSWQYLFASLISLLIPVGLVSSLAGTTFGAAFTLGASAAVMAITMIWLFSHPLNQEKIKHAEAVSSARLEDSLVDTEAEFEEHKQVHENQLD